jgi:hypothetical protein
MEFFDDYNLSMEDFSLPALECVEDEQQAATAIETAVSLENMLQEISRTGGVSRSQMQYLKDQCGLDLGKNYPVASFTEQPSQVNFVIAKEGMVTEFFTSLATFVRKIVKVILTILKWIWDFLAMGKQRQEKAKTVTSNMVEVHKTNQAVEREMARAGVAVTPQEQRGTPQANEPAGENPKVGAAKLAFEAYVAACQTWESHWNDLRACVLSKSHAYTMFDAFGDRLLVFMKFYDSRLAIVRELFEIKEDPNNPVQSADLNSRYARVTNSLGVVEMLNALKAGGVDTVYEHKPEKEYKLAEIADLFGGFVNEVKSMNTINLVPPINAVEVVETRPDVGRPLFTQGQTATRLLDTIIKDFEELAKRPPQHEYSEYIRNHYKMMMDVLASEVRGMRSIIATYATADQEIANMVRELADIVFKKNVYLEKHIIAIDGVDPKKQKELLTELVKGRSRLEKLSR